MRELAVDISDTVVLPNGERFTAYQILQILWTLRRDWGLTWEQLRMGDLTLLYSPRREPMNIRRIE